MYGILIVVPTRYYVTIDVCVSQKEKTQWRMALELHLYIKEAQLTYNLIFFKEMLYMTLKIDAYAIACYVRDVREQRFPQKSYKDMSIGQYNTKQVQKLVSKYQRNNVCVTVPFEGSSSITSKTNTLIFSYKEKRLFGKTHEVSLGQINLILKDMPNSLIFFNNSKALVLVVESSDIIKFDILLGTSDSSMVDLAAFLKENNVYVESFELIL